MAKSYRPDLLVRINNYIAAVNAGAFDTKHWPRWWITKEEVFKFLNERYGDVNDCFRHLIRTEVLSQAYKAHWTSYDKDVQHLRHRIRKVTGYYVPAYQTYAQPKIKNFYLSWI